MDVRYGVRVLRKNRGFRTDWFKDALALTCRFDSYLLGVQKQRLLPSGSVTANSRRPKVWSTGAVWIGDSRCVVFRPRARKVR